MMITPKGLLILLSLLLITLLAISGCQQAQVEDSPAQADLLAIVNGQLIDGTGTPTIADGVVLIQGNVIVMAGSAADVAIPEGARILDARGGTIMPGLIDSHVHSVADVRVRRRFLESGVTSVCDLGSPLADMASFANETSEGLLVARGLRAGPIITNVGGLPDAALKANLNYEVDGPEQGRAAVVDLAGRGVDMIKVYLHPGFMPDDPASDPTIPMLDLPTLKAVVDETHGRDLLVRAHVTRLDALERALQGEVDVLEHIPLPRLDPEDVTRYLAGELDQAALEAIAMDQVDQIFVLLEEAAGRGLIMTSTMERLVGETYRAADPVEEERWELELVLMISGQYHALDGPIALATDFNIGVGGEGELVRGELVMLTAAGLTTMEAIEAGTRLAAAACGQGDRLGTLEAGKLADLIVVAGNPLADLSAMSQIGLVILDGQVAYEAD